MNTYTLIDVADLQIVVIAAQTSEQARKLLVRGDERFCLYAEELKLSSRFLSSAHIEELIGVITPQILLVLPN